MGRAVDAVRTYRGLFDSRVWILAYGQVIQSAGRGMLLPFMALYFYNVKGFPLTQLGAAWALSAAVGFFAAILAGGYADRIGRRPLMLAGTLLNGASIFAFAFVDSVPQYYAASLAQGAVMSLFPVASRAAVADMTPRDKRVRAYGLLYMANNLGMSLGLLVAGFLIVFVSYRALFFIEGAAHLAYFAVIAFAVPETFRRRARDGPPPTTTETLRSVVRDFRVPLGDYAFIAFIGVDILAALGWSTFYNVLAPYMKNYGGLPDALLGPLFAINTVMVVLLQIPLSAYAERRGRTRVILQAHYALAWSLLAFWAAARLRLEGVVVVTAMMGLAVVVYTFGEILRQPVVPALVADLAPSPEDYGKYMGFLDVVWIAGGGLGAIIGGLFFDAGRAGLIWPTFALLTVVSMAGLLAVAPRLDRRIRRGSSSADVSPTAPAPAPEPADP